eukprot:Hpha_TRINITY_DN29800_c0_g1::TRINITY_DN29800_c0_g1_i1::g.2875::m.2875/K00717/FUT8; glycoprotein 6-alpha-L-fucosyltransferase
MMPGAGRRNLTPRPEAPQGARLLRWALGLGTALIVILLLLPRGGGGGGGSWGGRERAHKAAVAVVLSPRCRTWRHSRLCREPIDVMANPLGEEEEPEPPSGPDLNYKPLLSAYHQRRLVRFRQSMLRERGLTTPLKCVPPSPTEEETPDEESFAEGLGPGSWPRTAAMQRRLWKHQHPADCSKARFLVWRMWNAGLGADLHTYAQALSFAIKSGRVLLLDTEATWWYAADRDPPSFECFFIPPSNCTLEDAGEVHTLLPEHLGVGWSVRYKKMTPKQKKLAITSAGPRTIGNPLDRLVGDVSNPFDTIPYPDWAEWGYQWRVGQSVRYLLRRMHPWLKERYDAWVRRTFPGGPPNKIIGIHVRHGDKHLEMKLLPLSMYMRAAEKMRDKEPDLRDIFISTEDPNVLLEAREYTPRWRFFWTEHERSNEGSPKDYAALIGPSALAELSIVNLLIQSEVCTHWVGTDKSNWNRLINEMRATGGKLNHWYHQLNRSPCKKNGIKVTGTPPSNGWTKGC